MEGMVKIVNYGFSSTENYCFPSSKLWTYTDNRGIGDFFITAKSLQRLYAYMDLLMYILSTNVCFKFQALKFIAWSRTEKSPTILLISDSS